MSKLKDYADQQAMLSQMKAESSYEFEVAEQEYVVQTALNRLTSLLGRAKAVEFVEKNFIQLPF